MNKEQRKQIEDYSSKIEEIENFVEAVRQVPGMYIGPKGNAGHLNMIRETYQNAIDELIKCEFCNLVKVSYDERTCRTIIEDNGRGIPFELLIKVFTSPHTSSNYKKEKGEYSSGLHGVGAKVTNALSTEFTVLSSRLQESRKVDFIEGYPTEENVIEIENKENKQGTMVTFIPSFEIMGNITTKIPDVLNLIKSILYLTDIGSTVEFNGIHEDGTPYSEMIINEDGLISFLILKTLTPVIKPIQIFKDTGYMKADLAFTFDSSNVSEADLSAFGNMCPTTKGTHIDGFLDGVCKFFREYMNKVYLSSNKKNKLTIINNDIKAGLRGVISAFHLTPVFTGQAKEILSNEDLYGFVKGLACDGLDEWSKANPNDLQKLCKYFKDIAEIRNKADKDKVKLTSKFGSSLNKGLPLKFTKPTKSWDEFAIVEGDSAGGSAKNSRNKETQGIFPIKGKIPNALTTDKQKFLNNEEVRGIISIVGGGYGNNFDITKVQWKKIIFMPDADPDGAHIATLLLKLFLVYMRPLIDAGMVYKAVPPLYGIELKGGKHKYFTERIDYIEYLQDMFSRDNMLTTIEGNKMSHNDIMRVLYNNVDYTYELERIAKRYSLEPRLLELLLFNKNDNIDSLRNRIKNEFRFMNIDIESGIKVLTGIINSKYQTLYATDKFYCDVKTIEDILQMNDSLYYSINGQQNSLYQLMKKFEKTAPKKLTRYKGLGEMDPDQLAESTLLPNNRTLVRYTAETIEKDLDTIRYLESNRNLLIKDIKATRLDLIG